MWQPAPVDIARQTPYDVNRRQQCSNFDSWTHYKCFLYRQLYRAQPALYVTMHGSLEDRPIRRHWEFVCKMSLSHYLLTTAAAAKAAADGAAATAQQGSSSRRAVDSLKYFQLPVTVIRGIPRHCVWWKAETLITKVWINLTWNKSAKMFKADAKNNAKPP